MVAVGAVKSGLGLGRRQGRRRSLAGYQENFAGGRSRPEASEGVRDAGEVWPGTRKTSLPRQRPSGMLARARAAFQIHFRFAPTSLPPNFMNSKMKNQMKKLMFMTCLVLFALTACADDDLPIRTNQLPRNAQQFLTQYFRGVEVSYAKQDDEGFDKSYEVVFVDGNKVEFRRDGEWKEVDCRYGRVPDAIVPRAILDFVRQRYAGQYIRKIERDRHGYEVKLTSGLELKFDRNGRFRKID